ncbi:hypothetical protein P43SY_006727 [Pythium insidiosum]|uniref:Uncharacterized protein n=1 Tax=Pythium insidiosum TaxID=114742 RepID=A0AAD5QAJ9_PYTIN|nr:hypothetical protein P43SY_006727 [Pythium insidiosum]
MGSSTSKALHQEALEKPLEPLPVPIPIIHDTQYCIEAPTTYLVRHKYGKDESTITMWEYTDGKRAQDITFHVKSFNGVAVSYATSHGTRSFTVSNAARQQVIRAGCVGHADFAIKDASASRHDAPICMLKRSIAKWEPVIVGQVRNRSTGHVYAMGYTGNWKTKHIAQFWMASEKTPEIRRPIARTVGWGENDMRLAYQLEVTSGVDILALISMITVLDVSDEALSSDVFAQ